LYIFSIFTCQRNFLHVCTWRFELSCIFLFQVQPQKCEGLDSIFESCVDLLNFCRVAACGALFCHNHDCTLKLVVACLRNSLPSFLLASIMFLWVDFSGSVAVKCFLICFAPDSCRSHWCTRGPWAVFCREMVLTFLLLESPRAGNNILHVHYYKHPTRSKLWCVVRICV
jgi:hypothetical protein